MLKKEIKDDTNRWKDDLGLEESILSKGKVQKKKKKGNVQIQCNPNQITNDIFFTEIEQKILQLSRKYKRP